MKLLLLILVVPIVAGFIVAPVYTTIFVISFYFLTVFP